MAKGPRKPANPSQFTRTAGASGSRASSGSEPAAAGAGEVAARLTLPDFLAKFVELSMLAAFVGAVIAYHLSLPAAWQQKLSTWMSASNGGHPVIWKPGTSQLSLFIQDFSPALSAGLPILELKTTVWLLGGLLLIGAHLMARLYESFFRVPVLPPLRTEGARRRSWLRLIPLICILAYLVLSLVSFSGLGWAPHIPGDAMPIAPPTPGDAPAGMLAKLLAKLAPTGGGTYQSWSAWVQVLGGLLFLIVAQDVLRTRRLVYKVLGLMLGLGVVAAAVAVLVQGEKKVGISGLSAIWVKWGDENNRNDVAGFIGHNTALSSFLIAPMLIAWTQLLAHARKLPKWGKGLIYVSMTIMATALIMAQSRAVIPILVLAFIVLTFLLARRASLKPNVPIMVGVPLVVAVVILSQFINVSWNPLYRQNFPLQRRLHDVTIEHLKSETRLRMLLCSLPVVREHAALGTGFGSFQYIIPEAQGEYYATHPESWLMPTPMRSFHAHNEYLQTLVETGVVGLAVALVGLACILISGWLAIGKSFRQRHIALQLAVCVALGAMLAHCFLDFPLRVAPLCSTIVMLLAIWGAGERLWPIDVPAIGEREPENPIAQNYDGLFSSEMIEKPPLPPERPKAVDAALGVTWLVLAAGVLSLIVVIGSNGAEWFAARALNLRAQAALDYYTDQQALGVTPPGSYIETGHDSLNDARRLTPLFGEPYFYGARVLYVAASAMDRERIAALKEGKADRAEQLRKQILAVAQDSQRLLARSLCEFKFHGSYHQRAVTNFLMFRMTQGAERKNFEQAALEDLQHGVLMNPGDPDMIRTLIDWMERYRPEGRADIEDLYRKLRHFHPGYFDTYVMKEALTMRSLMDYEGALRQLQLCVRIDGTNQNYHEHLATTAALKGELAIARDESMKLAEVGSPTAPAVDALLAVRERQYDEALHALESPLFNQTTAWTSYRGMIRQLVLAAKAEADGDAESAARGYQAVKDMAAQNPDALIDAAQHLESVFGNHQKAVELLRARLLIKDPRPSAPAYAIMAEAMLSPHRGALDKIAEKQRLAREKNEPLPALEDSAISATVEDALKVYDDALLVAKDRQELLTLRARALQLRGYLKKPDLNE